MIKKLLLLTTGIAVTLFALMILFNSNNISSLITTERTSIGILIYKMDFKSYLTNIELSLTDRAVLELHEPTKQMIALEGLDWYKDLAWDLKVIVDYIILIINILIYPLRIGGYALKNILAIIGINVTKTNANNPLNWLVELAKWLAKVEIPYTPA